MIVRLRTTVASIPYEEPIQFATRRVKKRDFTIVELETDDGSGGFGVVGMGVSGDVSFVVEDQLARVVIGKDPMDHERIWTDMYREVYRERKGTPIIAISAVDIALWDLVGKCLKQPIWKILGGYRTSVPCYASGGYYKESKDVHGLEKEIAGYLDMGFTAFKIKIGAVKLQDDIERVKAVRDLIGQEAHMMVDANNAYDSNTAIRVGRALERFNPYWFEEPVWPDDLAGGAKVAASLDTPIASGELEYLRYGFRDLIEHKSADIIQPDATICGGISEWVKIAYLAAAYNIPVAPHDAQEVHVHLGAACPQLLTVEFFPREEKVRLEDLLFDRYLLPRDGMIEAPRGPGLGVGMDTAAVEKFKTHEKVLTLNDLK